MNNLTKEQYNEHINRLAEFMAHVCSGSAKLTGEAQADLEKLWQTLGTAFMALRRERIDRYGMEDTDDE
jgi:hypothetical protein